MGLCEEHSSADLIHIHDQTLQCSIIEAFNFFSNERNLQRICPPLVRVRICKKTTPDNLLGTKIEYRMSFAFFPIRWRSEICFWDEGREFHYQQDVGPLLKWHHAFFFSEVQGETHLKDEIRSNVQGGKWIRSGFSVLVRIIMGFRTRRLRAIGLIR